ncbi:hypothetical protein, partial [Martelella sp. UBA3392]|uniref:hypothetical protein n=1 Tax=Martelella sp. UBA3392 TaxID=1946834 RepID=UPI0031F594EB
RHSYGYAVRASSRGMTGLGKQNGFHLRLKGSRSLQVRAGATAPHARATLPHVSRPDLIRASIVDAYPVRRTRPALFHGAVRMRNTIRQLKRWR